MPPWHDIDTIMFDMDGTLLDLHFDNYFWLQLIPSNYGRLHGISEDQAREIVKAKYADVFGTLQWYCLSYWEDELQLDVRQLKHTIKHKINIRPNVEQLLEELHNLKKQVLLITNAHPFSLEIKMQHTGMGTYFHERISSHSLKLAKENPGFWESLRQRAPFDPDRSLLIDDSIPVLRQARREGIKHLLGITQPDSQGPPLECAEFSQIDDFAHILPSTPESGP